MTTATRPDVRIAERAGFCYGVRLAIDKAKHAREQGQEVTTLGQLVHNPGIKADLSDRGIRTADLADQVEGGTLVIRAHGVPATEMEKLRAKEGELEVIDATCTWVLQSQKAARDLAEAGYTVCIIGHEDHPEVKGVRSYAGDKHVVVDDMDRSTWERVPHTKKLGVLSVDDPAAQAGRVRRLLPAPMPRPARRQHRLPGDPDPTGGLGRPGRRCRRHDRGRRQELLEHEGAGGQVRGGVLGHDPRR
jgi:hypothetical protein